MSEASRSPSRRRGYGWTLFLALRYMRSGRRDAFVSFLSLVAVAGIALGVASLVLALSALNGLQRTLRGEILRRTPEIEIEVPPDGEPARLRELAEGVTGVEKVTGRTHGFGWALAGGSALAVEIVGYDGVLPRTFPEASGRENGVYVSDRVARHYGLEPGSWLELAATRSTLSPLGPVPRVRRLRVLGTFGHPLLQHREQVAIPLGDATALLGPRDRRLVVSTGDLDRALVVAAELGQSLPEGTVVRTWEDLNAPLLFALRLEKQLMFLAVFLIVLVASLALVSDLSLIIASRQSEIGILGTMGASARRLRNVFLLLGGLLAGIGVVIGGALGTGLARLFDRFGFIRMPGDGYLLDHIPFHVELGDIVWIVGLTLLAALTCSWIGANRASELEPVEALRS